MTAHPLPLFLFMYPPLKSGYHSYNAWSGEVVVMVWNESGLQYLHWSWALTYKSWFCAQCVWKTRYLCAHFEDAGGH